ncbi:hypothetical protein M408DRAFT_332206 [Serendipita vermifera MAFF 305830]|uniref:DUF1640 domain-containing protein n=1 Tax=Serendipita vermifera MAFF 305830 TaxID=933852 RepID=A0A0C2X2P9_SERVB|nr:hypothetical protein M408DRAFT_332206 [Serendipita vermifera MAFF 305830]
MIPRISFRAVRCISSQATVSPGPPLQPPSGPSTAAGAAGPSSSTSSQHPHAQLEESQKLDQNAASGQTSTSGESDLGSTTGIPSNAILIRDPRLDSLPQITPFHTYNLFTALEKTFPTPVARTLMKSVRGLLVDRMLKIRRDALDVKDLDNQAYLFRAALSELRTEATLRTKNQSAVITTSISSLRRDLDRTDVKMKEDIGDLKHEIQMEMDNHRNESRANLKSTEIRMEDVLHRTTVTVGDIRTEIEQAKWDNTRRGVAIFASFVLFTIISMELKPSGKKSYPPKDAVEASDGIGVDPLSSTT